MSQPHTFESLVASVNESIQLLEMIKGLFGVHEQKMRQRNLDAIEDNNEALAAALMRLNENFRHRVEIQRSFVSDLNEQRWANHMATLPAEQKATLEALWKKLDESLGEVQKLSMVNQQIVRRGLQQVDQLVSILQGKGSLSKIYDNRGASGHVNSQSTIGKA